MTSRPSRRLLSLVIPIFVVASALLFLQQVEFPGHSRLHRELNNAGHIPLFGVVAIALLPIIRRAWPHCAVRPLACYGIALVVSAGLGAGIELVQYWSPRDADLGDALRNTAGAAAFLALHAGSKWSLLRVSGGRSQSAWWRLFSLAVLLVALAPLLFWSAAFLVRNQSFPVICRFDSLWLRSFVGLNGARFVDVNRQPDGPDDVRLEGARKLVFTTGRYPGIELGDVYPRWTGFDSLLIIFHSGDDAPAFLWLRIDDQKYGGSYTDRFNAAWSVRDGPNRLAVGLDAVQRAPRTRTMDMSKLQTILLFADSTSHGKSILLQEIRLQ